ncbi:DNA repair exonuclease [Paenibacillus sp. CF384]|uniref:metallophosphoesterase family protein n=1 Tax=Paenibacillus sp. CF384 TaxID=1884382 RepID=UPI000896E201|nr:DNA repair exonuclease [Paenibacillus sp. CF384]SDW55823.1 DNA repair exonuclease SbcCD nuclease subunit [Paenibacillus sp. CF384]
MGVSFRFIHAADLHVDSPFRGLTEVPPHVREGLGSSTFQAVRHLVEAALREAVDFVVISGDLYDMADRSLRAQLSLQREWQKLHAQGVRLFVIHGNHDPLSGMQANLEWPSSVHFFGADAVEAVPVYTKEGELAAHVHGISYGSRVVTANLASRYKPIADGSYQIALLHGTVDGHAGHDPYAPCSLAELIGAGFQYWALGHIHQRAVLHRYPHVVYAGNTQGRHANETGAKGCYLVDVSETLETKLRFLPLDTIRWETLRVTIAGVQSEQALLHALEQTIASAVANNEGRSLMIKLRLEGRGPMHRLLTDAVVITELLGALRERIGEFDVSLNSVPGMQWCWVHSLEAATGAELDLNALSVEDSFTGELIRSSNAAEVDEQAMQQLLEEALQSLSSNARIRKMVRAMQTERAAGWFELAKELAAGMLTEESDSQMESLPEQDAGQGGERH